MEKVLTSTDIATRWGKTRQVINNWIRRRDDFPKPCQYVSNGSIPLFKESDIKNYEEKRGIENVQTV